MNLLFSSMSFIKDHFRILIGLGLVAAFGRVIQLGGFGEIPQWANILLEIVVESSRILIFLFALGVANFKKGVDQIKAVLLGRSNIRAHWSMVKIKLKNQWSDIAVSFCGFLIIAGVINLLIDALAYETCLFLTLQREGILVATTSEWTILLFFKNILVIPFTLVFETLLLIWITSQGTFDIKTPHA